MKIKLCADVDAVKSGSIVDCDEIKAKDLIDSKKAIEYTDEVKTNEEIELKERINKEVQEVQKVQKIQIQKGEKMTIEKKVEDGSSVVEGQNITIVKDHDMEWKSMGQFLKAVQKAETTHEVDKRLLINKTSTGLGEDSGGVGGFLVQHPLWSQEIYNAMMSKSVIAPKCRQFVAEPYANGLKFKQVAETARTVTSTWGGVRFYEVDEGVAVTDSKPAFQQLDVPIKQMGALYYITQALIDDCPNLSQYVAGLVGQSYGWMIDNEVMNGSLSIMTPVVGHLATVAVTVAGANPTAIEWASIYNAVAPSYRNANCEWYMSIKTYAGLINLSTAILASGGSSGIPLVSRDFTNPAVTTLFGHKINIMEQSTAQSTAGNILFGDFSEYALVTKGSMTPQVAMSLHVAFLSNQQCYRFIARIGGAPLLYSKVTMPDTSVVSNMASRN